MELTEKLDTVIDHAHKNMLSNRSVFLLMDQKYHEILKANDSSKVSDDGFLYYRNIVCLVSKENLTGVVLTAKGNGMDHIVDMDKSCCYSFKNPSC